MTNKLPLIVLTLFFVPAFSNEAEQKPSGLLKKNQAEHANFFSKEVQETNHRPRLNSTNTDAFYQLTKEEEANINTEKIYEIGHITINARKGRH
jgi:hypothetical protein